MKVVCLAGGRDLPDSGLVESILDELAPDLVLVGDCPTGADRYARRWVKNKQKSGVSVRRTVFAAMWNEERYDAGPCRNGEMADTAHDYVVAGHKVVGVGLPTKPQDPKRPRKGGTWNCVGQLRDRSIDVITPAFSHEIGEPDAS